MNWEYRNREYHMEHTTRYGQYVLNGYHCTNDFIWDWATDEEDPKKMMQARYEAERFVRRMRRYDSQ